MTKPSHAAQACEMSPKKTPCLRAATRDGRHTGKWKPFFSKSRAPLCRKSFASHTCMSSADPFVRGRPRLLTARMLVAIPLHSYTTHAAEGKDRFPKNHMKLSRAVLHHSLDLHLNIIRLLAAQAQTVKEKTCQATRPRPAQFRVGDLQRAQQGRRSFGFDLHSRPWLPWLGTKTQTTCCS